MPNTIKFPVGNTFFLEITPIVNGESYTLLEGDELRLTVKPKLENRIVIEKTLCADDGNIIYFSPKDTAKLLPGKYQYDIGINISGEFFTLIEQSDFFLEPAITSAFGNLNSFTAKSDIKISGEINIPTVIDKSECVHSAMTTEEILEMFNKNL